LAAIAAFAEYPGLIEKYVFLNKKKGLITGIGVYAVRIYPSRIANHNLCRRLLGQHFDLIKRLSGKQDWTIEVPFTQEA